MVDIWLNLLYHKYEFLVYDSFHRFYSPVFQLRFRNNTDKLKKKCDLFGPICSV